MAGDVCVWWKAYTFDNWLRRLLYKPEAMFGPYVEPGMIVMDIGCGMGFNAIGLARMVGDEGRVIAVDLQQKMLDVLQRRATRAGVADRIRTHKCDADSIGIDDTVAFAVAFWVVHEVPDAAHLLQEVHSCLSPGGHFLVAEPRFHVSDEALREMIALAEDVGLKVCDEPGIRFSKSVVFRKT